MNIWKALYNRGIIGINARNLDYVLRYNPRHLYPLVDDKIRTKQLAINAGINAPELYGTVEIEHQINQLLPLLDEKQDFVIKPAHGAGGDGILIITDKRGERFRKSNGMLIRFDDISHHVSNILSGVYSLGGIRDVAMIEYRVRFDPLFEAISYQGVPDIRIIVLHGYPVMSMVRLPTRGSDGKANLHQGAVGVGIDIPSGRTLNGVWFNEIITTHPDTGNPVAQLQIPHWHDFLFLAASCYELTGLGYLGVDIVLDSHYGPMMLELNARPGLNIQIANNVGLRHRLEKVESILDEKRSPNERIAYCQEQFASID